MARPLRIGVIGATGRGGYGHDSQPCELEAERIELALTYQSLAKTLQENAGMHGLETLARTNLEAAAPGRDIDRNSGRSLDSLVRSLITFTSGNRSA